MIKKLITSIFLMSFSVNNFAQHEEDKVIKLLFLGDIMAHDAQLEAAYNKQTDTYSFDTYYQYISSILTDADFAIGNIEVTLGTKPYSGYPRFSSPPELVKSIKDAGVDVLATANNHSCDRRKKGVENTITILDSLNLLHTGTFIDQKAKNIQTPLILEKNNIKIALLNYTFGTNGIPVTPPNIVNLLDKKSIIKDIAKTKNAHPDHIIAFVHWGTQYQNLPNTTQKKWFQFFKSQGVDIVIGSHPHVVQPMEWDRTQENLVIYSLGNFISNQRPFPRDGGAIFELTLTKEASQSKISNARYMLTWVYKQEFFNDVAYFVLPVDEFQYKSYFFENRNDYESMMKFTQYTRRHLEKNNQNIQEYKPFSDEIMREMYIFLGI